VRVPVEDMGRQAVRQLMIQAQVAGSSRSRGCRIRLLPELIMRQSSGMAPTT